MMLKKEHLLHYMMKGHVHLSKKDYGFFNNLAYIIKEKNQVTSNQNKLFDKLILKYQRQLRKCGHNIDKLQQLNWDVNVVNSSEEYLIPKLYLEGNELCLRTPFNTNFVRVFKTAKDNTFLWQKDQRIYRSHFYTHALRQAYDNCLLYFEKLDMDETIRGLIEPLLQHEGTTKMPILTVSQGKYYINNINKNLSEAIRDIQLNDDPKTLYQLSRHGISIDRSVIGEDPLKLFASEYITRLDLDEIPHKMQFMKYIGITDVYIPIKHASLIDKNIRHLLEKEGIKIHASVDSIVDGTVIIKRIMGNEKTLALGLEPRKIGKVIHVTNSRPVEIR